MKQEHEAKLEDELRPEYDFATMQGGVRGKYADRFKHATNVVILDPDVAQAFPTDAAVNEALRLLMNLAKNTAQL